MSAHNGEPAGSAPRWEAHAEDHGEEIRLGEVRLGDAGLELPLTGFGLTEPGGDADEARLRPSAVTAEDLAALAEVQAELNQRWPETKIDPTLDRVAYLMDILGHPERAFASIHVAGTNGKTSTVRMIESLLRAFHRRTGRTTSPHLQLVTERISIDGAPVHPRDFVEAFRELGPFLEMADAASEAQGVPRLSTFEVLIGLAYSMFADAPVDVAVVETGMGGRWDATNVIDSAVAVITPIGLDHTDYLGETIEEIAGEKAGIISAPWDPEDLLSPPDTVTVVGRQEPAALRVLLEEAVEKGSSVARFGSEFAVLDSQVALGGQQLTLQGLGGTYTDIFLPLSGAHQAENAAVALAAVEAFFGAGRQRQLDQDTVRRGFAAVTSPGRLERVRSAPNVFVDVAHNPHGARALAAAIGRDFSFRRLIGVVSVLGDKDARGVLAALEPVLDEVVITACDSPRVCDPDLLAEYARDAFGDERVHLEPNVAGALELATQLAEDDEGDGVLAGGGVLVTGSVVIVGQARALLGCAPA